MHFINTLAVLLSASMATSTLAAPLDTGCSYESDNVHVTCKGDNAGYPRGIDVTYNLGKRFDAEMFMRRSDAVATLARGMDEQRIEHLKRDDAKITIDPTGDLSKTMIDFGNGTTKPLSDYIVKPKTTSKDVKQVSDVSKDGKPITKQSITTNDDKTSPTMNGRDIVGLGNNCDVDHANNTVKCAVKNPKRAIVEPRDTYYGDSIGGGSVQGSDCNFGSGNIYTRRQNGGAHMTCTKNAKRAWLSERDDTVYGSGSGMAQGNVCNFGNGNIQARDGSGAQVHCTENGHPTYGPNAGTTIVRGPERRQNNQCIHGNKGDAGSNTMTDCVQNDSPIYGPNGGKAIIIARNFDLSNVNDVTAYHNEIRSFLPTSNRNYRRDQEVCSGVPVGPVGPQAVYYTRRSVAAAAVETPSVVRKPTKPVKNLPTPVKRMEASKSKRCINTPIPPVPPTVSYLPKSQAPKDKGSS